MSMQSVALIVDDEPAICWGFERLLSEEGHQVLTASSAEEGLRLAALHHPALVILDVRLPGEDGLTALPRFQAINPDSPIIVITAFGDLDTAVTAVRRGAADYLTKPFRLEDAVRVCRDALRLSARETTPETQAYRTTGSNPRAQSDALIGQSPAMQQVFRQIALVADSDLSVLITGETGTGKELVAAAIHKHSRRSEAIYLPIAPVSLNPSLIESELFGHVKGAFTGADDDRRGLFETAEGGTIFLDEIGDLPASTQVKLLRVLERRQFTRVGDIRPRDCHVRIIAATHCDLAKGVQEGTFREDLLYRLSAAVIHLPALRERASDIPLLAEHFLRLVGYPDPGTAISPEVANGLMNRPWLGNIRELRNAVEHAAVVARGRRLSSDDFPMPQVNRTNYQGNAQDAVKVALEAWLTDILGSAQKDVMTGKMHEQVIGFCEATMIQTVLNWTHGNRATTADLLGIHRGTLREKIRRWGIAAE